MKKKLLSLVLAGCMVASLAGCGSSNTTTTEPAKDSTATTTETTDAAEATDDTAAQSEASAEGYELALVTDIGTIDDKSFNQGAWEGVVQYAEESGKTYKYYQPAEKTTDSYAETIELAIEGGAKIVVCPGYLFEEAVFIEQDLNPDVKFILLDGEPHNADYSEYKTADNTMAILFQEDQPGFLAGYAAVKEGYTKLGFMGGMAVPAVIRYGYGFLQGAEYAANEMGIDSVEVSYNYTGGFDATPEVQALAASWYGAGTEVIFGCGGGVGNSVMAAAEASGKVVIGVDVDQSPESATVITSAMKKLSVSVYDGIKSEYDGAFAGGQTTTFSAANDGVGLPMDTSKFTTFSSDDYDTIFGKLAAGEIEIKNDSTLTVDDLGLKAVKYSVVE
ncbi:BMP family lipoprotein [Konateibacter massiliensis]|uniref:BMP family lipoprotein n=1 Tax=Konateibacter massiliensis TaxID=2002841 RepID=UPI000C15ACD5|nr:BMP family ABC transporter substrate-binding protein [Konateibacter massiliensis]